LRYHQKEIFNYSQKVLEFTIIIMIYIYISAVFNPYSAEPVLEITFRFFSLARTRVHSCNYLLDEASREDEFSAFNLNPNNLRSKAHGQLRLEQAKVAIAFGVVSRNGWKIRVLLISTGLAGLGRCRGSD
jgi:hypothetical protein